MRNVILILALSVVIFSTFAQSFGASALFDDRVLLEWKSDPALRSLLHHGVTVSNRVNVLLVFSTIPTSYEISTLTSLCQVNTFTGHVATVSTPVNLLPTLAGLPFVSMIAMPKGSKQQLDVSVPEILADQVWNTAKYPGVRDSRGRVVNGAGVIIGFDDISGIDYQHRDFTFPNGTDKVLYIWDQSSAGTHPDGYTYGNECTPSQIQSQTCTEFDFTQSPDGTTGHETAVAAVAASTGQASNDYVGVAPGASIIAVKLAAGDDNYVIDAINYMISKARQLNRPLVIVHSLGDTLGSHDGTDPLELAFTDFVSEGVPIVVAAGNDGGTNVHVSGELVPGETVHVPWSMSGNSNSIDLWYPVGNILSLSIITPSGVNVTGPTPDAGTQTVDGVVLISPAMRPTGREWWVTVNATAQASRPNSGWTFVLTSVSGPEGKWDAWTEPGQFNGSNETLAGIYMIDHSDTIDTPGTARGVITVGAYMTKYSWWARCTTCMQWAAANGYLGYWWTPTYAPGEGRLLYFNTTKGMEETYLEGGPGVGQILEFSSLGPTRDGRMKPEIVAPGANIATARAANAPQMHSDPDNYHQVWAGTSFSAPHVGGVIALMLQMNPYLSPDEITNILESDARQDDFTGIINKAVGSPIWGWGKVNALRATLDAPSLYSARIQVTSVGQPVRTDLILDGVVVESLPLNVTKTVTLEFRKNETHTIELTPVINLDSGSRYVSSGSPWTFSEGGTKTFSYQLQYYLQVNSPYGDATGSGWYDANETATASISPISVDGHQFQGWIGSLASNSQTANVTMNSSKDLTATWSPGLPTVTQVQNALTIPIVLVLLALTAFIVLVAFVRPRTSRGRPPQTPSEDSQPPPS